MNALARWGPVVLVMAVIFTASSFSDPGAPPGGLSDKSAHVIVYAALGAALVRALAGGRAAGMTLRRVLTAAALATLYGVTDEVHQLFVPGRNPEALDVAADALGGLVGAAAWAVAARAVSKRTRSGGL